jgi:hypothetical protein
MGAYVNPKNESKENFLSREGTPCSTTIKWFEIPNGKLPVFLLDNVIFTAAGIAFSEKELQEFSREDGRRKRAYLVDIEKLHQVSPELRNVFPIIK